MKSVSYKRYRFPPDLSRDAVRLYFRAALSLRDVVALLVEGGIEVSDQTIRCWTRKFGELYAANLRLRLPAPTGWCQLDEMVVKIPRNFLWVWRALDDEGDMLVQRRRNKRAAYVMLRKLLGRSGNHPEAIVTDKLTSYRAALRELGLTARH